MNESSASASEHYFSASPSGELRTKEIEVTLAGQNFRVETSGGIFSPDHVDAGTEALLRTVENPPASGNLLDVGSGWGPIALTLALESPQAQVFAVDVNERALELTQRNARRVGADNVTVSTPDQIDPALKFDVIWSNPPIRVGKAELHNIMTTWLPRLNSGGQAWLVIAKHLGADSFEKWLRTEFGSTHEVERADTYKGFRVLLVERTH